MPDQTNAAVLVDMPDPNYQSLGELIVTLEATPQDHVVPIGFHRPHSYRGDYMDLAFEAKPNTTVAEMLAAARSALDTTYEGWKGGDFVMDASTPVWLVKERGDCGESLGHVLTHLMLNTGEATRLRAAVDVVLDLHPHQLRDETGRETNNPSAARYGRCGTCGPTRGGVFCATVLAVRADVPSSPLSPAPNTQEPTQ